MVNDDCPRDALLHALVLPSLLAEICIGKSIGPSSTRCPNSRMHICPLLSVLSFLRTSPRRCSVSCRTAAATLGLWFR
ncbi:hypothetical protein NC653_028042 [Populus alba x Populus x berolinensis]|uniref:Uncharacterized protein n=1 Tax=Populus alba x Populus x berolinensis TaxID=444605 RepID=A0AAD6M713_9ROSI|nr:hypothetical protein NC653_028042 [Populus alba x Populus x berolinensis]